jgi:hypothetical protein
MTGPGKSFQVIAGGRAELERAALRALVRRDETAFALLLNRLTSCSNSALSLVRTGPREPARPDRSGTAPEVPQP